MACLFAISIFPRSEPLPVRRALGGVRSPSGPRSFAAALPGRLGSRRGPESFRTALFRSGAGGAALAFFSRRATRLPTTRGCRLAVLRVVRRTVFLSPRGTLRAFVIRLSSLHQTSTFAPRLDGTMRLILLERKQPRLKALDRCVISGALGLFHLLLELLGGAALAPGLHPPQTIGQGARDRILSFVLSEIRRQQLAENSLYLRLLHRKRHRATGRSGPHHRRLTNPPEGLVLHLVRPDGLAHPMGSAGMMKRQGNQAPFRGRQRFGSQRRRHQVLPTSFHLEIKLPDDGIIRERYSPRELLRITLSRDLILDHSEERKDCVHCSRLTVGAYEIEPRDPPIQ